MTKLSDAIERIKTLECPTEDVVSRVAGILEDYGVANKNEISLNRDKRFDKDGAKAYSTTIPDHRDESIVVLAKSGSEDYVAKVVDTYMY